MYLLDTNICIYAINGRHPKLTEHLLSIPPSQIYISSITIGELEYGAAKSHWGERTRQTIRAFLASFDPLPFTADHAIVFGQQRALLASKGIPIGVLDLMIASQGLSNKLKVVTHNTRDFSRIEGLQLEDWAE
ncbi:type II toxin-antitoxin system VapC family toxin [Anaerovibrio lipolyticus]|uniref:type II toxin-antitoxin system tRNA(fMet)-specific endonuclease VapC n=1 Tax=Anaerovibrio lipolyticus TaxID=82374 RepID=UPI0023EF76D5|nr:type II toxin-antitoxin system VapC family toxin [Anaerovibrio lipolyticus]